MNRAELDSRWKFTHMYFLLRPWQGMQKVLVPPILQIGPSNFRTPFPQKFRNDLFMVLCTWAVAILRKNLRFLPSFCKNKNLKKTAILPAFWIVKPILRAFLFLHDTSGCIVKNFLHPWLWHWTNFYRKPMSIYPNSSPCRQFQHRYQWFLFHHHPPDEFCFFNSLQLVGCNLGQKFRRKAAIRELPRISVPPRNSVPSLLDSSVNGSDLNLMQLFHKP